MFTIRHKPLDHCNVTIGALYFTLGTHLPRYPFLRHNHTHKLGEWPSSAHVRTRHSVRNIRRFSTDTPGRSCKLRLESDRTANSDHRPHKRAAGYRRRCCIRGTPRKSRSHLLRSRRSLAFRLGFAYSQGTTLHPRLPTFRPTLMKIFAQIAAFLAIFATVSAHAEEAEKQNRLRLEASAYLQMHAGNPVDWYPWGTKRWPKQKRRTNRSSSRSAMPVATGAT